VGRYWKVALLMPYVIKPQINMKRPEPHILVKIFWWLVLILELSIALSALGVNISNVDNDCEIEQ
jgi:hypothetical protein